MNKFAIFAIMSVVASVFFVAYNPASNNDLQEQFASFMNQYKKSYDTEEEMNFRMQVFKESLDKAAELNIKHPKAHFGVTEFSDLTDEEFSEYFGKVPSESDEADFIVPKPAGPNAEIDFRSIMQPVQHQGSCGSCWAFASAATFEGRLCWNKNICQKQSEQEFVDCVHDGCHGCGGGDEIYVYKWLMSTPSCTSSSYPYKEVQQDSCFASSCQTVQTSTGGYKVAGEQNILGALQDGPVSIGLNFDEWPKYYQGGIVTADMCTHTNINHAITLVGYHEDSLGAYWIVRNSHGSSWGESGHFRLEYGTGACQMGKDSAYPTV